MSPIFCRVMKKAVVNMQKEYTVHSKEERSGIVKQYLAGESSIKLHEETGSSDGCIRKWKRLYIAGGEAALENKKKPGNPLSKYERRKELTRQEQLEYHVELLKRELMKREAEVVRLKNRTEGRRYPKKVIQKIHARIKQQSDRDSIAELCKIYSVSRSGCYMWRGRTDQPNRYEKGKGSWMSM